MPKVPTETVDQSEDPLALAGLDVLKDSATVSSIPVAYCGVSRKINTGNFENIDVYFGLSVPVAAFPQENLEEFKKAVAEAAELGFLVASRETAERYSKVKDLQSGDKK